MGGPCSYPAGDKRLSAELDEIVCDVHFHCTMAVVDKDNNPVFHDYITYRVWLSRRNRLVTGKTR